MDCKCNSSYIVIAVFLMFLAGRGVSDNSNELLRWEKVSVSLTKNNRAILQINSPGSLSNGRLTGLIGPSGCGKTTFLNLIAGKLTSSSMTSMGPLKIFSDIAPQFSGAEVAFVYQDDSFFSMLTVLETLQLTANLRLTNVSDTQRANAVNDVIAAMALTAVQDSAVGDATGTRGISGGERKRLAVACELLSSPELLVADEPTSGLDSHQAFSVVKQLKNTVVTQNIAGVITLHQPRSSIWALLDDIVLLAAGGRVIYHGTRSDAGAYFKRLGYPLPPDTNPAEHLIDLVSVDHTSSEEIAESQKRIDALAQAYVEYCSSHRLPKSALVAVPRVSSKPLHARVGILRAGGRALVRFALLLQRSIRQTLRDNATNVVRMSISAILAFVVGGVYGHQPSGLIDEDSVGDRVTIIAQAAIQVSMLAMLKTLQLFKRERTVVSREIATRQYGSLEYLLSKSFAELPVDAIVAGFFGLILHHRTNLHCNRNEFVATLSLLGCASSSLGLAISALSPTGEIALAVGPALMVIYVIAGALGPGKAKIDVSWALRTLRAFSPIRPACEALCMAEFQGQSVVDKKRNLLQKAGGVLANIIAGLSERIKHPMSLLSRGEGQRRRLVGGDYVLRNLGIGDSTASASRQSLVQMLAVHSLLALIGLMISNLQAP